MLSQSKIKKVLSIIMITCLVVIAIHIQPIEAATKLNITNVKNSSITIKKNKTFQLKTNYNIKKLKFKSSNVNIITVSKNGKIKAKKYGTANVTISLKNKSNIKKIVKVTVAHTAKSIKFDKTKVSIEVGNTFQLNATILPTNTTNKNIKWKSSNTNVAKVSSKGLVTAKNIGTTIITGTTKDGSNKSTKCKITVTKSGIKVSNVSLTETNIETFVGRIVAMRPQISPSNATNKSMIWTSSNTDVAVVNSEGIVTTNKVGVATITGITNDGSNKSSSCQIIVKEQDDSTIKEEASIALSKNKVILNVNESEAVSLLFLPSNIVVPNTIWTSSNSEIATVNNFGLITGVKVGTCVITVKTTDGSNITQIVQVEVKDKNENNDNDNTHVHNFVKNDYNGDSQDASYTDWYCIDCGYTTIALPN